MGASCRNLRRLPTIHGRVGTAVWVVLVVAVFASNAEARELLIDIDSIRPVERDTWATFVAESERQRHLVTDALADELARAGLTELVSRPSSRGFSFDPNLPDEWYRTDNAHVLFEAVISFQTPAGGWPKNVNMSAGPRPLGGEYGSDRNYRSTFDNGATISELRFLARYHRITNDTTARAAFKRGLSYILRAQFPNGGWPQVYPLVGGYHDCITLNDGAMVGVLGLLRDIVANLSDFEFLSESEIVAASTALETGIECLLKTQVAVDGILTAWCQQYDPVSMTPHDARAYEMVSLSSSESAEVVEFLLSLADRDERTEAAMATAIAWLKSVTIEGFVYSCENGDCHLVAKPDAGPLWARFYEIGTNRPLFGDRDGSIHYDVVEISIERRRGYGWFVTSPQKALKIAAKQKKSP